MSLQNKTFFITGGTGFIGKALIKTLLSKDAKIYCYGRSKSKIEYTFGKTVISMTEFPMKDFEDKIDYVIHAACPTESSNMANKPVEVIDAIYTLTKESLELAKRNNARYIFLSSMEVYDNLEGYIDENSLGIFDLSKSRTSYPIGKQLAENLVNSYHNEYAVNTCIIRLSQIFGPGVQFNDNRFFIFALRKCLQNDNIVLNTSGEKWHNSCYVEDAVNLILELLKSNTNETYNITNEDYCMSINELCEKIIKITKSSNKLTHDIKEKTDFRPDSKYKISGAKIQKMFPSYKMETFENAIRKTFDYLRNL